MDGLTIACPATDTVGTVSFPSATERTNAAASGSRQMFASVYRRRVNQSRRRSFMQYGQPGRQWTTMPSRSSVMRSRCSPLCEGEHLRPTRADCQWSPIR